MTRHALLVLMHLLTTCQLSLQFVPAPMNEKRMFDSSTTSLVMTKSSSDDKDATRKRLWRKRPRSTAVSKANGNENDPTVNETAPSNETIMDLNTTQVASTNDTLTSNRTDALELVSNFSSSATAYDTTANDVQEDECLIIDVQDQTSINLTSLNNTGVHCIQLISMNRTSPDVDENVDNKESIQSSSKLENATTRMNVTASVDPDSIEQPTQSDLKLKRSKRSMPFFRKSSNQKIIVKQPKKKKSSLLRRTTNCLLLFLAIIAAAPFIPTDMDDLSLPFVSEGDSYKRIHKTLEQEPPVLATISEQEDEDVQVHVDEEETTASSSEKAQEKPALSARRAMALSYVTDAVHKVGPSVLRIDTESNLQDFQEDKMPSPLNPGWVQQGQGSGLIFSSDGFILTNAHVVEDASKVTVTMTDGRVYNAEVRGVDEIVDIAVLKILPNSNGDDEQPVKNLPVAELGDSDELNVGQIVIAVGTPGGLDNTVTMGIVSGLERSSQIVGIPHKKVDYIQTDAAINPGNSGGPLVDVESGRVVGINACIRANMEGTSFAIPINRVRELLNDLSNGKHIQHGYVGVSMATCSPEWARQNNSKMTDKSTPRFPEVHGALVGKVFPRTPAMDGGLCENDVVTQIGGKRVRNSDDARRLIDRARVGEDLTISVLRDNRPVILTVRPVDLATRLREMRQERQRQIMQDRLRFQELGPLRALLH
jgi:S1-C subfamily serine protease